MEIKTRIIISLVVIISYSSVVSSTTNTSSVVLDVDGKPVLANTSYYVFSPNQGGGGGLFLSYRDSRILCPMNVGQENNQSSRGRSLKMFPVDNKQVHITTHTDMNIESKPGYDFCMQPSVWRMEFPDPFKGIDYVRVNGIMGQPGRGTVRCWFKLERFGEFYKIWYCPNVCGPGGCNSVCGEVGLYVEKTKRWLGLRGQPLVIAFKISEE